MGGGFFTATAYGGGPAYDPDAALKAWIGGATYADWHARKLLVGNGGLGWQESTEVTPIDASGQKIGSANSVVGGFTAKNPTSAQRLNMLISSGRYTMTGDGTDDNLLTTWLAASGGNTVFFDVDVPATLARIFGSANGAADRICVSFDTNGRLSAGVGSQSESTIVGTTDWRGQRCVGAATHYGQMCGCLR